MSGFGTRIAAALDRFGGLCLGIDPHDALLDAWSLERSAAGAREFGLRAVEAASGVVGIVKPQVAFFERFGSAGIAALEDVVGAARDAELLVISDAKRGDIGSTMTGYAQAWLEAGSPLESDALTVSPFLGAGSLLPAVELARSSGKGLFVLAATSNPEGRSVQSAERAGVSVARSVFGDVESWNRSGALIGDFGVVIGATIAQDGRALGVDLADGCAPILAPGFGAQGARLREVRRRFGGATDRVVANVSRDALSAGPGTALAERLRVLAGELEEGAAA